MGSTITAKNVQGMGGRCIRSAQAAGIDVSRWALIEGSRTYGNPYLLVEISARGAQSTIHRLGYTRGEAYGALHAMAVAFELAAPSEPRALAQPCDNYQASADPKTCGRCWWTIGAHSHRAGGPSGVGAL